MNLFYHALLATQIGGDIENLTLRLSSVDTTLNSFYWFIGYKSEDFPEVICDRDYFFIYSTDHDSNNAGAIMWGKGNNIDLTDFVEVGQITSGYQSETPQLIRIPSADGEVLHLYFHTYRYPGYVIDQETHVFTSAGGAELHNMDWTFHPRIFGNLQGENHTGYARVYKRSDNDYLATHITKGGLPQPWFYSTSTDGRTWTRGNQIDTISGTENGYFAQLSDGLYFEKYGQQWWIGQLHPETNSGIFDADKKIALCKSINPYRELQQIKLLNNGEENLRHTVMKEGDIAHIFITNPKDKIYHGTYDLTDLKNYL